MIISRQMFTYLTTGTIPGEYLKLLLTVDIFERGTHMSRKSTYRTGRYLPKLFYHACSSTAKSYGIIRLKTDIQGEQLTGQEVERIPIDLEETNLLLHLFIFRTRPSYCPAQDEHKEWTGSGQPQERTAILCWLLNTSHVQLNAVNNTYCSSTISLVWLNRSLTQ